MIPKKENKNVKEKKEDPLSKNDPKFPKKVKNKPNLKVTILSLIAIIFLVLTFTVHWLFIMGAIIIMLINQKELIGKEDKSEI
ncbi:hypothetical protein K0A97_02780 [Patescibacteria group bacterium]|nr:hypothetical protein [Patescibacteria group bacterium]